MIYWFLIANKIEMIVDDYYNDNYTYQELFTKLNFSSLRKHFRKICWKEIKIDLKNDSLIGPTDW